MIFSESMSVGEKLLSALSITILGMLVVFSVLVIIAYSLELLRILFGDKPKKKDIEEYVELENNTLEKTTVNNDDSELIVLLTAAIAAFESTSSNNIIVRSIRELPQNKNTWAAAGRQQLMTANNINKIRR
jgi:sodium pump decarboxylase gamma subunit